MGGVAWRWRVARTRAAEVERNIVRYVVIFVREGSLIGERKAVARARLRIPRPALRPCDIVVLRPCAMVSEADCRLLVQRIVLGRHHPREVRPVEADGDKERLWRDGVSGSRSNRSERRHGMRCRLAVQILLVVLDRIGNAAVDLAQRTPTVLTSVGLEVWRGP